MASRRPWILVLVGLGLAAAVVVLAGDLRRLPDRLVGVRWRWFAVALLLSLANYTARWVRWQLYLHHQRITVPVASSIVVFGAGLSLALTPAKLGELAKSYLLREMHNVPTTRSAPIVFAERITDLLALFSITVIGVSVYGVAPGLVAAAGVMIVAGLMLLAWPRPAHALIDRLTRPRRLRRFRGLTRAMYDDLATMCQPGLLAAATAIAVPAWLCECLGFGLLLHAFPNTQVEFGVAAMIYALTTIAGALSFLPGGLGVTEGAMMLMLVHSGGHITTATAFAATLLTRFATLWFGVAIGMVFMVIARRRISSRVRRWPSEGGASGASPLENPPS
jgi:glycosyltransferase 2 family protein